MSLTCREVMEILETLAPRQLAVDWDNPGLNVGRMDKEVHKILVALDAIDEVVKEAISVKADLIVTHHPIIFGKFKTVNDTTPLGKRIMKLIRNDIGVYAAHTNLDIAYGGTNDTLAEMIGLKQLQVIEKTEAEALFKLVIYTPEGYEETIRQAMFAAGAGAIGQYSNCTFAAMGTGTFLPGGGTKPFIGSENQLEYVSEARVETIVKEKDIEKALYAVLAVHPYEEAAYDIYRVEQTGRKFGIGRVGALEKELSFQTFALQVKDALGLKEMRVVGSPTAKIKKVGICTGAGTDYMAAAKKMGCDAYITGDLRYHESQKALDMGLCVIDATHYASEVIIVPVLCRYLKEELQKRNYQIEIIPSKVDGQTFYQV